MQQFLTPPPSAGSPIPASTSTQTVQQIAWGAKVPPAFKAKVISIAHDLGTSPDYLMAAMAFESSETFSPSIPNAMGSRAVGLIQFMPRTAIALGTTNADLRQMSAEQQLDYVKAYFQPYVGHLDTLDDVYMAILYPAAVGKPSGTILFSSPSLAYQQNRGLDANHDGNITKAEATALVYAKLRKGLQPGFKG
jgi:hypothetical protein